MWPTIPGHRPNVSLLNTTSLGHDESILDFDSIARRGWPPVKPPLLSPILA
jgi:hypothetical protein